MVNDGLAELSILAPVQRRLGRRPWLYTSRTGSPDSINEQYQGRVNWRATDKISFQLSGGLEDQQYLSGGAGDLVTPIFGATIQYLPFEQTQLSVSANRTVSPSVFQNQTTENTGITPIVNQRLLGKLHLDLSGAYGTAKTMRPHWPTLFHQPQRRFLFLQRPAVLSAAQAGNRFGVLHTILTIHPANLDFSNTIKPSFLPNPRSLIQAPRSGLKSAIVFEARRLRRGEAGK